MTASPTHLDSRIANPEPVVPANLDSQVPSPEPTGSRNPETGSSGEGWLARLQLRFAASEGKTLLVGRRHTGPLLVQRTFHPADGVCHTYIVHPPGGVVGGDRLELQVAVEGGAHALLTTPAAAKFYRTSGATALQSQELIVDNATLEWLPQESIFYCDARVRSTTRIHLSGNAQFIGWEIPCLGLPARGETFERGELRLALEVWRDELPLLIDRLRLDGEGDARTSRWGLAGHEAIGTLLAYPAQPQSVDAVRSLDTSECELAATLVDDVLVCRCVAAQAGPIHRTFVRAWEELRPMLLGVPAMRPRIWGT
jgi:urease accessory protein